MIDVMTEPANTWHETGRHDIAAVSGSGGLFLRANRLLWLLLTVLYVFAAQPLRLVDVGAVSPFSQIRAHGGSNHLLMPTSLLQQWAPTNSLLEKLGFGGGVVRITACSSDFLNAIYPGNATEELRPDIRALLLASGHIAQEFYPAVMRMPLDKIGIDASHWQQESGMPFPAYTLPALELRRMLRDARALNGMRASRWSTIAFPGLLATRSGVTPQWRGGSVSKWSGEHGTATCARARVQSGSRALTIRWQCKPPPMGSCSPNF
jgi:hypothetical protein